MAEIERVHGLSASAVARAMQRPRESCADQARKYAGKRKQSMAQISAAVKAL